MTKDYKYIRAWGKMLGSFDPYIEEQIERAREDNAPEDAIYKNGNTWRRFPEIESDDTKRRVRAFLLEG